MRRLSRRALFFRSHLAERHRRKRHRRICEKMVLWQEIAMAKIKGLCVGESLVGEGNEVAHIDLILGPRGSSAEASFCRALTSQREGVNGLLAVIGPNLMCKPSTVMFNN